MFVKNKKDFAENGRKYKYSSIPIQKGVDLRLSPLMIVIGRFENGHVKI